MVGAVVLAVSLAASGSVYASPVAVRVPVQAKMGKTKMVSMNLRNDTKEPVKVKAGETEMTLEPGKLTPVKLPEGTTIIAQESTASRPAGSVIATVSSQLSDATVALK
jgi:hypothetical protein